MKIIKESLAGTVESSDLMVKVAPASGKLDIIIRSEVYKQFGQQIRQVVDNTLQKMNVTEGQIVIEDKGALDCVIRARLQIAILRAADYTNISWEALQ